MKFSKLALVSGQGSAIEPGRGRGKKRPQVRMSARERGNLESNFRICLFASILLLVIDMVT